MSYDDDETKMIRTLAPHDFPTELIKLQFCWRIELGKDLEDQIWQKVISAVHDVALPNRPSVAVVGRPGLSTTNDTIHVDLFDDGGRRVCSVSIEQQGAGTARVMWHESQ